MPTTITPSFVATFDIVNNHLTFTDTTTGRGSTTQGTVRITHTTSDTIIYDGSGWNATTPTWSTPPIDGSTSAWAIANIDLPTDPTGSYKFEYWTRVSPGAATLTTRTFELDYTAPEVSIEQTVLCSTSQLVSDDATNYDITYDGVTVSPTITRSHTIVAPAGATYTGTLGTTAEKTRTIGGGATSGTRLWTRTWQTVISTGLSYTVSTWGDSTIGAVITDTVKGNDEVNVTCNNLVCDLAQCFVNLFNRWKAARTSNFAYYEDKTPTVIEAIGLWSTLQWLERCGEDTQATILSLQTLLAGENCTCTQNEDTASVPVVPWAAITGTGGTTSTFVFWTESGAPTGSDGNDGDMWLDTDTGDLYKKSAGAWALKDNLTGPAGTPGTGAEKIKVLVSDIATYATPASTTPTAVSYAMAVNNTYFDWEGDSMEFTFEVKLGANDNGKTLNLYFDSDNMLEWFTDDLVTSDNDIVVVHMKLVRETNITQHITCWLERAGQPGEIHGPFYYRSYSKDLNTDKTVVLYGTNATSTAGDVTGYHTEVILKKRETELIEGGDVAGTTKASQLFVATEGQTDFTVTDFTATPYYLALIDYVPQSDGVVTRSGQVFTYAGGLTEGQTLLIVRI